MKTHWHFFKEGDTSFGLFYPLHYIVAAFATIEHAEAARNRFLSAGFDGEDVAAVSGAFVINHLESEQGADWFDRLRAGFARIIGTEAGYMDDDSRLARRGGAFLFVYAPNPARAEQSRRLMQSLHPLFARRYHRAGIESLRYPPASLH